VPQPRNLDPSAYAADGGQTGALLIHGFTGSVAETRPMGEYLAAQGLTVRCPLLPGHGTSPLDLTNRAGKPALRWKAWTRAVEAALGELQGRCEQVFVSGLSLGALLCLWLGSQHHEVTGLIPMAPAVRVRNRLMPLTLGLRYLLAYNPLGPMGDTDLGDPEAAQRIWCYDQTPLWGAAEVYLLQRRVRHSLARIRQPVLIFQGRRDAQLPPQAAQSVYASVSSTDRTLVWLEHSGHNLLVDRECEVVWEQSYRWMVERARPRTEQVPLRHAER